jgi:hypothetical protein
MPYFVPAREIPDFDDTIATSTGESLQRGRVFGHGVDTVDVTASELSNEGFRMHSFQFDGIQGASLCSRAIRRAKTEQKGGEIVRIHGLCPWGAGLDRDSAVPWAAERQAVGRTRPTDSVP